MRDRTTVTDRLFLVAVLVKGLDGAVQLVGGIALAFLPPDAITRLAHAVVTRDLVGPPTGALAGHFEEAARHFAAGNRAFVVAYLLLHGAIKLVLVTALLREVLPVYPVAAAALGLFVLFEVLRAARTGSLVLPLLAALDVAIIVLVVKEYRELRRG
ncbi:DUF2127 domain-containing protein [Saccharopolyspora sp. NPDC000359]|uniref:DUF2127 domain-containing protein n=1 Tax=Saccharopolyspora sp. NPDC000359 TaxID=3154251 RepID=UPI0033165F29